MKVKAYDDDSKLYNVQELVEKELNMIYGSPVAVKQNYNALLECIEKNDLQGKLFHKNNVAYS